MTPLRTQPVRMTPRLRPAVSSPVTRTDRTALAGRGWLVSPGPRSGREQSQGAGTLDGPGACATASPAPARGLRSRSRFHSDDDLTASLVIT
jgi:hypothetical protein